MAPLTPLCWAKDNAEKNKVMVNSRSDFIVFDKVTAKYGDFSSYNGRNRC
jgi:hypothetical protein